MASSTSEGGRGPSRVGMRPVRDWVMDRSMVVGVCMESRSSSW